MKKLAIVSALLLLAGAVLAQPEGFLKARSRGQLTACKSNEKNLATALEMYASDFGGRYPTNLLILTNKDPKFEYLRYIPTCPAAGKDTYSATYKMTSIRRDPKTGKTTGSESFSFHCAGHNHKAADTPPNKPAYNSNIGLIVR